MTTIAMSREIATLGGEVSLGLAERLGLEIIHHELVEQDIAARTGFREADVHRLLEGEATIRERWSSDMEKLSHHTAREVLELAARDNVLIRGWGATYLLRHLPHVLCVRICAPMGFRERVLMARNGIEDAAVARREIERSDATVNAEMMRLFGANQIDPTLYAMVINTARIPVPECIEQIVRLAQSRNQQETAQSRQDLMNQLIQSRIDSALEVRFGESFFQSGLSTHCQNGKVIITGATTDERVIVEAIRLLQGVDGVSSVESKVDYIAFTPHHMH